MYTGMMGKRLRRVWGESHPFAAGGGEGWERVWEEREGEGGAWKISATRSNTKTRPDQNVPTSTVSVGVGV